MSEWINFKELRKQLRFADVLRHYKVEAKIKGDRATAFCPLPGHPKRPEGTPRTASLSINLARNIFNCFGCHQSGNALEFASRMEGFDPSDMEQFRQAALKIAKAFDIHSQGANSRPPAPPAAEPQPQAAVVAAPVINAPLDFQLKDLDAAHPYLWERGFLPATVEHFGLGFCKRGLMKDRIAIPLRNQDGELVGYAGRLIDDQAITDENPKYRFPGGRVIKGVPHEFRKSLLVYNAHQITEPVDHLFVVEGFPACWWLWQAEYRNAVALMGSDCSDAQAEIIVDLVKADGKVWAMSDGDPPGIQCAMSILAKVSPHRFVRWVKLQPDEQPTDVPADELVALFET
jgi:DNA primase